MLGAACERAGIAFEVIDAGHAAAASRVGAGLISPLTGRRLVPTWRFAEWREEVWNIYRYWEHELGLPLVREVKIRRFFQNEEQRGWFESRRAVPEVAAWVTDIDDHGWGLQGALQVETGRLIAALRERWQRRGQLVERRVAAEGPSAAERPPTIWCVGGTIGAVLPLPWQSSRGELVRGRIEGMDPTTVLNDGHWLLPGEAGDVRVGSTFDRDNLTLETSAAGQAELIAAAERLAGQVLQDPQGDVGLRVTVPDRRPVAGWTDPARVRGVLGGLAAKGALWAPVLAQQWCADGLVGDQLDPAARVTRFKAGRGGWGEAGE